MHVTQEGSGDKNGCQGDVTMALQGWLWTQLAEQSDLALLVSVSRGALVLPLCGDPGFPADLAPAQHPCL